MDRPFVIGSEVGGKYRLLRHIGSGGMGHVFEAEDQMRHRRIALKVLKEAQADGDTARRSLAKEAKIAASIRHPSIVQVYEVGCDGDADYVAMELLQGEDLHTTISLRGPLPVPLVERIALALTDALIAMHEAGVVHRDLKPSNLFLPQGAEHDVLKVLDFGVAKGVPEAAATLTKTGQVFGTLYYMAPEQLRGAKFADERSDLWSAGAVLYEALAGHPPFQADCAPELVLKIASDLPTPIEQLRPDVSVRLANIIRRLLTRDPLARYQSARELRAALTGGEGELLAMANTKPWVDPVSTESEYPPAATPRKHTRAVLALVALLLLMAGGIRVLLGSGTTDTPRAQTSSTPAKANHAP